MGFCIRKVTLSILWKPKMAVFGVNCKKYSEVKSQWNKPKLDSRYRVYKCNNRICDLLPLLLFCIKT